MSCLNLTCYCFVCWPRAGLSVAFLYASYFCCWTLNILWRSRDWDNSFMPRNRHTSSLARPSGWVQINRVRSQAELDVHDEHVTLQSPLQVTCDWSAACLPVSSQSATCFRSSLCAAPERLPGMVPLPRRHSTVICYLMFTTLGTGGKNWVFCCSD